MADTNKKEYTSNLHPKGDMDTTVYPNVKSENIIDKDTAAYTAGKVPDSSLVQKSLDGISENLETTKIQVATNKKNIETLQGNYTGLQHQVNTNSSDIALTKTQVETNKTNIAKNTQDIATNAQNIENLSAVTPTDVNIDANGYAILEHDGAEITGQNKKLRIPYYYLSPHHEIDGYIFKDTYLSLMKARNKQLSFYLLKDLNTSPEICLDIKSSRLSTEFTFRNTYHTSTSYRVTFHLDGSILKIYTFAPKSYIYNFPEKNGTIALTSDVDAKQDKRFVHTVEIHYASNGSYFCFTGTSDKNTPIDSVEKLTTVFSNRDLGGVGVFGSAGLSKIHVGSSVNDTTFKKYMNNGEYANPSEETFATVFNPTGFTITDSVSAL